MITLQISTPLGAIYAELDDIAAPLTVANFLRYVDAGYFTGGQFWRTVRLDNQPDVAVIIEVVQADVNPARKGELFAPIPLERTRDTGLRHIDGALSMSRFAPDSAMSSFSFVSASSPIWILAAPATRMARALPHLAECVPAWTWCARYNNRRAVWGMAQATPVSRRWRINGSRRRSRLRA